MGLVIIEAEIRCDDETCGTKALCLNGGKLRSELDVPGLDFERIEMELQKQGWKKIQYRDGKPPRWYCAKHGM